MVDGISHAQHEDYRETFLMVISRVFFLVEGFLYVVNSKTVSNPFPTDKRVKFPWAQLCHLLITSSILGKPGNYDNHLFKHAHCGVTKCHKVQSVCVHSSGLRVVESGNNYAGFNRGHL